MLVCEYDTIIQGSNQCKKSVGGVRKSWGIDWQNVESVQGLAETGTITGLTLKEGKTLKVLEYDNDITGYDDINIGIWKNFFVSNRIHRTGTWNESSLIVDNGIVSGTYPLSSFLCGSSNVNPADCYIKLTIVVPAFSFSDDAEFPVTVTVDGGNLITSINGVSC